MLKKSLLIIIILVELIAVALIIRLSIVLDDEHLGNENKDGLCLTPHCVHIASTALKFMDPSVDPCEDFYNFSCGNFMKTAHIPDEKHAIFTYSAFEDLVDEQVRTEIEKPVQHDEPNAFTLVKKLYQACMNLSKIEEIGLGEIKTMLAKFGGWPVLQSNHWRERNFDWKEAIYKLRNEGYNGNYLISFDTMADKKNSSRYMITFDDPYLGINKRFLKKGQNHAVVKAYFDYMVDVAVIFGANKEEAKMELLDSLKFEMELAQISLSWEERVNTLNLYNPTTIKELEIKYPSIPWLEYINNLLAPYARVADDEIVSLTSVKYIRNFTRLISVTPKRIQANYLIWRTVQSSVTYLTQELQSRRLKYLTATSGQTAEKPRWKQCILLVDDKFSSVTGAMYVRKYFDRDSKRSVEVTVKNIQAEFKEILENVDWMDEETKVSAFKKLASMTMHIAYPDELLDDAKIDDLFRYLSIDNSKFWKSVMKMDLFWRAYSLSKFHLPINKTNWIDYSYPTVINAYAWYSRNSIVLPAGILQGTFFHKDYPKYINYAGLGHVIGHEMTHHFDNSGRLYDEEGNLENWWSNETQQEYIKRCDCIKDQYSNYSVPEVKFNLNGLATLNENIADIAGIKEAYLAYVRWMDEYGQEPKLPGFSNYTRRQLFWIASGINWCAKSRTESLKLGVFVNMHSPERYRLWGSVRNSKQFAEDFNCKPNSKMNPVEKCEIW